MSTVEGLIVIPSPLGVAETIERLEHAITARGMTIFARFDHAANAHAVGLALSPTTVVVFGNARAGTKLMVAAQTIGIDLPLRFLVCASAEGQTSLAYNDPSWLARRHGIAADATIAGMTATLAEIAKEAACAPSSPSTTAG